MQNAFNFIYTTINSLVDLFFNRIEIQSGVYLGWVFVAIFVLGIFIRSILNIVNSVVISHNRYVYHKNLENYRNSKGGQ